MFHLRDVRQAMAERVQFGAFNSALLPRKILEFNGFHQEGFLLILVLKVEKKEEKQVVTKHCTKHWLKGYLDDDDRKKKEGQTQFIA